MFARPASINFKKKKLNEAALRALIFSNLVVLGREECGCGWWEHGGIHSLLRNLELKYSVKN